jgi:hypothetical protein
LASAAANQRPARRCPPRPSHPQAGPVGDPTG